MDINICPKLYAKFQDLPEAKSMLAKILYFLSSCCTPNFFFNFSLGPRDEHKITGDTQSLVMLGGFHCTQKCHNLPLSNFGIMSYIFFCLKLYSKPHNLPQAKSMFSRIIFLIYPCCTWTYTICILILVGKSASLLYLLCLPQAVPQILSFCLKQNSCLPKLSLTFIFDVLELPLVDYSREFWDPSLTLMFASSCTINFEIASSKNVCKNIFFLFFFLYLELSKFVILIVAESSETLLLVVILISAGSTETLLWQTFLPQAAQQILGFDLKQKVCLPEYSFISPYCTWTFTIVY